MRWAWIAVLFYLAPGPWALLAAQDRSFESNGVTLRYVEEGAGDAVVLIHGLGNTLNVWNTTGVMPSLSQTHRVIALDLRGHGRSDKPRVPEAYGRELGLDVIRLLDHLGIQRAHVVGLSLGGIITSHLLTTHPERFKTAILLAGTTWIGLTPELERTFLVEADETEKECVSRSIMAFLARDGRVPSDSAVSTASAACMADPNSDRFALASLLRSRRDLVISVEGAAGISVPILGVVGDQDPAFLGMLKRLKQVRPATQLLVIPGATHGGPAGVARFPEVVTAIRGMLSAVGP